MIGINANIASENCIYIRRETITSDPMVLWLYPLVVLIKLVSVAVIVEG